MNCTRRRLLRALAGVAGLAAVPLAGLLPKGTKPAAPAVEGFSTDRMTFKVTERYAYGWTDARTLNMGADYSAALARSMTQTREALTARILEGARRV